MYSLLSPEMLFQEAKPVQLWTERGDHTNAREEEGRQEGDEEEEVGAPGCGKGRWTDHLPILFSTGSKRRFLANGCQEEGR